MTDYVTELECNHCGWTAITANDGLFGDGDGVACEHCGMPGHVSADTDGDESWADWVVSDEDGEVCQLHECKECIRPIQQDPATFTPGHPEFDE